MDRRIHEILDQRRDAGDLTPGEREELIALESAIETAVHPIRSAPVPDIAGTVMSRISEMERTRDRGGGFARFGRAAFRWIWVPRPVTLRLRPAYGLIALTSILLLVLLGRQATDMAPHAAGPESVASAEAPAIYVQFRLEAQGASSVALAGSFTGWKPEYELRESAPGIWTILLPLHPGVHDYAFIVDGDRWVADPNAFHVDDGFGGVNSRIALPTLPAGSQRS